MMRPKGWVAVITGWRAAALPLRSGFQPTGEPTGFQPVEPQSRPRSPEKTHRITILFQFSGLVHSSVLLLTGFKFRPLRTFIGRLPGRSNVNEPIERIKPERGSHRSGQRSQAGREQKGDGDACAHGEQEYRNGHAAAALAYVDC